MILQPLPILISSLISVNFVDNFNINVRQCILKKIEYDIQQMQHASFSATEMKILQFFLSVSLFYFFPSFSFSLILTFLLLLNLFLVSYFFHFLFYFLFFILFIILFIFLFFFIFSIYVLLSSAFSFFFYYFLFVDSFFFLRIALQMIYLRQ